MPVIGSAAIGGGACGCGACGCDGFGAGIAGGGCGAAPLAANGRISRVRGSSLLDIVEPRLDFAGVVAREDAPDDAALPAGGGGAWAGGAGGGAAGGGAPGGGAPGSAFLKGIACFRSLTSATMVDQRWRGGGSGVVAGAATV